MSPTSTENLSAADEKRALAAISNATAAAIAAGLPPPSAPPPLAASVLNRSLRSSASDPNLNASMPNHPSRRKTMSFFKGLQSKLTPDPVSIDLAPVRGHGDAFLSRDMETSNIIVAGHILLSYARPVTINNFSVEIYCNSTLPTSVTPINTTPPSSIPITPTNLPTPLTLPLPASSSVPSSSSSYTLSRNATLSPPQTTSTTLSRHSPMSSPPSLATALSSYSGTTELLESHVLNISPLPLPVSSPHLENFAFVAHSLRTATPSLRLQVRGNPASRKDVREAKVSYTLVVRVEVVEPVAKTVVKEFSILHAGVPSSREPFVWVDGPSNFYGQVQYSISHFRTAIANQPFPIRWSCNIYKEPTPDATPVASASASPVPIPTLDHTAATMDRVPTPPSTFSPSSTLSPSTMQDGRMRLIITLLERTSGPPTVPIHTRRIPIHTAVGTYETGWLHSELINTILPSWSPSMPPNSAPNFIRRTSISSEPVDLDPVKGVNPSGNFNGLDITHAVEFSVVHFDGRMSTYEVPLTMYVGTDYIREYSYALECAGVRSSSSLGMFESEVLVEDPEDEWEGSGPGSVAWGGVWGPRQNHTVFRRHSRHGGGGAVTLQRRPTSVLSVSSPTVQFPSVERAVSFHGSGSGGVVAQPFNGSGIAPVVPLRWVLSPIAAPPGSGGGYDLTAANLLVAGEGVAAGVIGIEDLPPYEPKREEVGGDGGIVPWGGNGLGLGLDGENVNER
ncbi:hypothetical protein BJ742DRAFT_853321 [Cladochytrium replicatum]|nr:hypothetical protein BJ742DRAFT_853321 [Cladochytrium replicatum]